MYTAEGFNEEFNVNGHSVTSLAEEVGVARKTIYNWMNAIGYTPPKSRKRRRSSTRIRSYTGDIVIRDITPEKTEYQKFYEYMKSMSETNPDHPVYSVWLKSADSPRRKRVLENTITEFIKFKGMST